VPYEEFKHITYILDMLRNSGQEKGWERGLPTDGWSRQYYDKGLGAGMFVSPVTENGLIGYSEPLRRFIQHEGFSPQVNEIPTRCPPGSQAMTT
jgi:hypothetical protein